MLVTGIFVGSMSSEFRASRGVRLSRSRLNFSGFWVSKVGRHKMRGLTSFLATLAVRVLFAAHDDCVHRNENG